VLEPVRDPHREQDIQPKMTVASAKWNIVFDFFLKVILKLFETTKAALRAAFRRDNSLILLHLQQSG